jgi:hypothetical protein
MQQVTFSISPALAHQENLKLLGFELDSRLNWDSHISGTLVELSKAIHMLRKLKTCISKDHLRSAYFAFFHCHLNYGIKLWGHAASANDLFILQKRAVRIIANAHALEHCKPLFQQYGIMTLYSLYIFKCLCDVRENLHSFKIGANVHQHNTRIKNNLVLPHCRLTKTRKSFDVIKQLLFNHLPEKARNVTLPRFKHAIHSWLLTKPFYSINEFFECNNYDISF